MMPSIYDMYILNNKVGDINEYTELLTDEILELKNNNYKINNELIELKNELVKLNNKLNIFFEQQGGIIKY